MAVSQGAQRAGRRGGPGPAREAGLPLVPHPFSFPSHSVPSLFCLSPPVTPPLSSPVQSSLPLPLPHCGLFSLLAWLGSSEEFSLDLQHSHLSKNTKYSPAPLTPLILPKAAARVPRNGCKPSCLQGPRQASTPLLLPRAPPCPPKVPFWACLGIGLLCQA